MSDKQYRVIAETRLFIREEGRLDSKYVGAATPGAIVHVTGETNDAGYAPCYVFGWLSTDHKVLYSDSLSPYGGPVDAFVYQMSAFRATGAPDVYGRQPGELPGWIAVKFLELIE